MRVNETENVIRSASSLVKGESMMKHVNQHTLLGRCVSINYVNIMGALGYTRTIINQGHDQEKRRIAEIGHDAAFTHVHVHLHVGVHASIE